MANYEVKYVNLEFPPFVELSLPFIEAPEVDDKEAFEKLRSDSSAINQYFFPGLSEVLLSVEFVLRERYRQASAETLEHVQSVLEHEVHARETFPHAAYFRSLGAMGALAQLSPRVAERVHYLAKKNAASEDASEDPVLEQLRFGIEFHSRMIDIQLSLAGIQNQQLEKEVMKRDGQVLHYDTEAVFLPAKEFADFDLKTSDAELSDEDVFMLFSSAVQAGQKKYDATFFQRLADMLRAKESEREAGEETSAAEETASQKQTQEKKKKSS